MSNESKNTATQPQKAGSSEKFNLMQFIREVRQEFARVSWPTRAQVGRESLVVLLVVIIITVLVFVFDILFNFLFNFLIK